MENKKLYKKQCLVGLRKITLQIIPDENAPGWKGKIYKTFDREDVDMKAVKDDGYELIETNNNEHIFKELLEAGFVVSKGDGDLVEFPANYDVTKEHDIKKMGEYYELKENINNASMNQNFLRDEE